MPYDFTTHVDRRGAGSLKWEIMLKDHPGLSEDIVPLSIADMEFETMSEVKRALHELIDATPLGYTGPTDEYFESVISWQTRRHAWTPERSWILMSGGIVPAIYHAVRAFTQPGDGIIIQPPVYYPFTMAIEKNGRTVVENPLVKGADGRYEMDFDGLERCCERTGAKMIILSSPHNPVGRVWLPEELKKLAGICSKHGLIVLCDEIHNDLIMPGHEHTTIAKALDAEELERAIVCVAPSKTFNLAGVQSSSIIIPSESMRERYLNEVDACGGCTLSPFAYAATSAAYTYGDAWLDELIDVIYENYQYLCERLAAIDSRILVTPSEGTYLAWADFSPWGLTDEELERFMVEEALLFLDEGYIFGTGGSGHERFNLACPKVIIAAAMDRLQDAVNRVGLLG